MTKPGLRRCLFSAVLLTLAACGGGSDGPSMPDPPPANCPDIAGEWVAAGGYFSCEAPLPSSTVSITQNVCDVSFSVDELGTVSGDLTDLGVGSPPPRLLTLQLDPDSFLAGLPGCNRDYTVSLFIEGGLPVLAFTGSAECCNGGTVLLLPAS